MKPKKGDTGSDMEEDLKDPLQLTKELVLLIVEARTPDVSVKGRIEGPHCPVLRGRVAHKCTVDKLECIRASEFCYQTQQLCHNSIPICLDILFYPECNHGLQESLVTEGSVAVSAEENSLLIERWTIESLRKRQDESLSSSLLLQAVRSYLHFSQISSWLYSTGGKLPGYLIYRVYAPGEEVSLQFSDSPDKHTFPVCSTRHTEVMVSVLSLKRQPCVPVLLCALSKPINEVQPTGKGRRHRENAAEAARGNYCKLESKGQSFDTQKNSHLRGQNGVLLKDRTRKAEPDKDGWLLRKTSDSRDRQYDGSTCTFTRDNANMACYQKQPNKKSLDRTSHKQHLMKDGEGGRKKGSKVRKKDGEKDERIDQRKSYKPDKYFSHQMWEQNGTSANSMDRHPITVGQLSTWESKFCGALGDSASDYGDKFSFDKESYFSKHKDFDSFSNRSSCEKEWIKSLSKRLGPRHHLQTKNGRENGQLGKTFKSSFDGQEVERSSKKSSDSSNVAAGFSADPHCLSELSIMVPHVCDIFEDSDTTPVPSPNQLTFCSKFREDVALTSAVFQQSCNSNHSQAPSTVSTKSYSVLSAASQEAEAISCSDFFSVNKRVQSNAEAIPDEAPEKNEGKVLDIMGARCRPAAPCSRKLFEENLLPLVSYDAGSDSFVQVDLTSQAKVLHSPKVLFSCDIPHDYSQVQPQRKCIDFGDTLESNFFKGKLLGDVLDTNSIGKYMSSLAALSVSVDTKGSESNALQNDFMKAELDGLNAPVHAPQCTVQAQDDLTTYSHDMSQDSFTDSQSYSSFTRTTALIDQQFHACSPSLSSSSSSSSSICAPSSCLQAVQSYEELACQDSQSSEKSSKLTDRAPVFTLSPCSSYQNVYTSSLSKVGKQTLTQDNCTDTSSDLCHHTLINLANKTAATDTQVECRQVNSQASQILIHHQQETLDKPLDGHDQNLITDQPLHALVTSDGRSSTPPYSSLSSHCDRDAIERPLEKSTSFNNPCTLRASHTGPNDIKALSATAKTGQVRSAKHADSVAGHTLFESHQETLEKANACPASLQSSVPSEQTGLRHGFGDLQKAPSESMDIKMQQKEKLESTSENCVLFYLNDSSTVPSSTLTALLASESKGSAASDRVSSLSLESDLLESKSRTSYDGTAAAGMSSGSPPLHGDPLGWTSVPPHRTVSTPSCMDRAEKTTGQKSARPTGMIVNKCDTASQIGLRKMAVKSASMIFNSRTGLPSQSSPAPLKRNPGGSFDYDANLLNTRALKNAFSCSKLAMNKNERNTENEEERRRALSTSAPASTNCLLGNFEESILNGRIEPVGTVEGFSAEIGASGAFCPKHLYLPVSAFFFALSDDNAPSPYLGHINLESVSKKGYRIPKKGTVQVTLFNPNKTVVKMFVVMYDLSDMPLSSQTFIRQRTVYCPADINSTAPSYLRYLIHLRCASSHSGKIYLHTDIRLIFARHKLDIDAKSIAYELKSYTEGPSNPKYSPKK